MLHYIILCYIILYVHYIFIGVFEPDGVNSDLMPSAGKDGKSKTAVR